MYAIQYPEKYCPFSSTFVRKNRLTERQDAAGEMMSRAEHVFYLPGIPGASAHYHPSLSQTPPAWDQLAEASPALLSRPFLNAIESAPPAGLEAYYLIFRQQERPVGIAYFQRVELAPDQSIKLTEPEAVLSPAGRIKKWTARQFRHTLLLAGNALLTGQHAYYFSPDLPQERQAAILEKASWQLAAHLRRQGRPVDAISLKDISARDLDRFQSWNQASYRALRFQPHMEMELRPEWRDFEDYLDALSSKYRVRARRAAKKSADLQRRWLEAEEIRAHTEDMHALYRRIADQSDFNLIDLHPGFFYQLKEKLGDQYEVLAYFQGTKMVGFCTLLHHGSRAEAHFLGFEEQTNRSAQLYLNMLYDLIRRGVEQGKTRIGFARTAMEIKSSIGARPEDLYCLTRAYNPLFNGLVTPMVNFLIQDVEWEPRHPFR